MWKNDVVLAIKSEIDEVVKDAREPDFDPDAYEGIYDDCNLDSEEAQFGLANDADRISSQDAQSIQEDTEPDLATLKKTKSETHSSQAAFDTIEVTITSTSHPQHNASTGVDTERPWYEAGSDT